MSSLGVPDSQIDDLLNDHHHAGLSARNLACLQFCLKLSRHARSVCSKDIETLRASGFNDESILEAVVMTALAVYRCTLSVGLGPEPDLGSRKIASTRFVPTHEGALRGLLPDNHEARREKGLCLRSVPESQDVCTFCHRSESRIHTELFPR